MSIATEVEDIGTVFHLVWKEPQIQQSMCDVPNNRCYTRISTVPNHTRACRSPVHTCWDMRPCTGPSRLADILNIAAFIGLTFESLFSERNELGTRFDPAPMSSKLTTVCSVSSITLTDMNTRYGVFCKKAESARNSLIWSEFCFSSTSSSELALPAGPPSWLRDVPMIPHHLYQFCSQ